MKMKKFLAGLGAFAPAAVFAEGETTAVSGLVTDLQTAAENAISSATPAVVSVLVALFGVYGVFLVYKLIRRAIGR